MNGRKLIHLKKASVNIIIWLISLLFVNSSILYAQSVEIIPDVDIYGSEGKLKVQNRRGSPLPAIIMIVKYTNRAEWENADTLMDKKVSDVNIVAFNTSGGATLFSEILLGYDTETTLLGSSESNGYFRIVAAWGNYATAVSSDIWTYMKSLPSNFMSGNNWKDALLSIGRDKNMTIEEFMMFASTIANTAGTIVTAAANVGAGQVGTGVSLLQDISYDTGNLVNVINRIDNSLAMRPLSLLQYGHEEFTGDLSNLLSDSINNKARLTSKWFSYSTSANSTTKIQLYLGALALTSITDGVVVATDLMRHRDIIQEMNFFMNAGEIQAESIVPHMIVDYNYEAGKIRVNLSADQSLVSQAVTGLQYTWIASVFSTDGSIENQYSKLDEPNWSLLLPGDKNVQFTLSMSGYENGIFYQPRPIRTVQYLPPSSTSFDSNIRGFQLSQNSTNVTFYLTLNSISDTDITEAYVNFGDGIGQRYLPINGKIPTIFNHEYSSIGNYNASITFLANDGRIGFIKTIIMVDDAANPPPDDGDNHYPHAVRDDPAEEVQYVRMGQRMRLRLQGSDEDGHLSHVIYSTDAASAIFIDDNDLRDDFNDGYSGAESVYIDFIGDNNDESVQVKATVYDTAGKHNSVWWTFYIEPVFKPILSNPIPSNEEALNLSLGGHDFEIGMYDKDDNAGDIQWYLNGLNFESTSTNGGGTFNIYEERNIQIVNQGIYQLEARVTDDDGNSDSVIWTINAGFNANNNLPVITVPLQHRVNSYDIPYTLFRVGRVYQFYAKASDVDEDLFKETVKLNGETILQNIYSVANADDLVSEFVLHFKKEGENIISVEFEDGFGGTTKSELVVNVLPEDTTTGGPPAITEAYPAPGNLWVRADKPLEIDMVLDDPDGDQEGVIVIINNAEKERIEFESCSHRVRIDSSYFISSQVYNLKLIPYDSAGHYGVEQAYSVYGRQYGNHPPQIEINDLWGDGVVRAGVTLTGERRAYFYYHAYDVDGDIARVEIIYNGVDPADPNDYTDYSDQFNVWDIFNAGNAVAGTVTLKVTDSRANSTTVSIPVIVSSASSGNAPQFVNHNLPENGSIIILPSYMSAEFGSEYELFYQYDFFDQDGDLKEFRYSVNNSEPIIQVLRSSSQLPHYFSSQESLWSGGVGGEEKRLNLRDLARGVPHVMSFELEDHEGNITRREWTIIRGPWGTTNHTPIVENTIYFEMDQGTMHIFSLWSHDEEGDILEPSSFNLPAGDELEYLGEGRFEYTPHAGRFGNVGFTIDWDDKFGGIGTTEVNLFIIRSNNYTGDLNGDGNVDLVDLVLSLKLLTNDNYNGIIEKSNSLSNEKIGLSDSVFILRNLAEQQ